jgi:hypothetical protein
MKTVVTLKNDCDWAVASIKNTSGKTKQAFDFYHLSTPENTR